MKVSSLLYQEKNLGSIAYMQGIQIYKHDFKSTACPNVCAQKFEHILHTTNISAEVKIKCYDVPHIPSLKTYTFSSEGYRYSNVSIFSL